MVISRVYEEDLESIAEVVLLACCMAFTYIYTPAKGLFRCGNGTCSYFITLLMIIFTHWSSVHQIGG